MRLRPRRLPRGALYAFGGLVLLVVLAGIWAVIAGLRAKSGLESVRADLTAVRDHPPARQELVRRLKTDAANAKIAHDQVHQLGPTVVSWLPIVGRSMVAERTIADAATAVLSSATVAVDATDGLGGGGTGLDLGKLQHLHDVLATGAKNTAGPLHRLAGLDTGLTPGVVGKSVRQAQSQLDGLSRGFDHAAQLTDAVGDLLGSNGDRTIYIGLENNAELRGTGGLISTFTLAHAKNGHLTIDKFRDSQGIAKIAAHAVTVPAPPDYTAAYGGYLANSTLWLNATMDPDVPATASVISTLAEQSLGVKPDAVLLLDVAGMAKIVSATGPLHLSDGSVLSGDALIKELLVTEYGDGSYDQKTQDARHAKLAEAAGAGFAALTSHESDVSVLKSLATAASGRHLALWSSTPAIESELDAAGVSGSTNPQGRDLALVTVNNLGDSPGFGNKLDYYATRAVDLKVVVGDKSADVTETVTIGNRAPAGLGPYVQGSVHPGRMHLLVQLATAKSATLERFDQDGKPIGFSKLALTNSQLVTVPVELQRGETGTWQLQYSVPVTKGRYSLRLLPQPLASAATLTVEVSAAAGQHLGTVTGADSGSWTTSHNLNVTLKHPSWWDRKLSF